MALSLNRLQVIGNLGRDPEIRQTNNGVKVANLSVATKHRWTDKNGQRQEKVTWHNLVAWDKVADLVESLCFKGQRVFAEGAVETESYVDGQGNNRQKTVMRLQQIMALDTAKEREAAGRGGPVQAGPVVTRVNTGWGHDDEPPF